MSLGLLLGNGAVAGTMGLLAEGAAGLEQCWGMLGDTGSILTMAGAELRETDGERTTGGRKKLMIRSIATLREIIKDNNLEIFVAIHTFIW